MALAGNKADLEDKRKVTAEVSIIVFQHSFLLHVNYQELESLTISSIECINYRKNNDGRCHGFWSK